MRDVQVPSWYYEPPEGKYVDPTECDRCEGQRDYIDLCEDCFTHLSDKYRSAAVDAAIDRRRDEERER